LDLFWSGITENRRVDLVDADLGVRIALATDGFARPFAGAGIGEGSLAAHGQSAQMADAAVAFDGLQSLEIQADLAAQVAFGDIFAVLYGMNDLGQLLFVQTLGPDAGIN